MKYEILTNYSDEDFRRITGIKRNTFAEILEILNKAYEIKHAKGGRKSKLEVHDMLLAALEYWREYRTYAHIAASYGVDESNIFRTIQWVEDILIKSGKFSLPGKKALLESNIECEIILIDATETPIERPKKNKSDTILERKNVIL